MRRRANDCSQDRRKAARKSLMMYWEEVKSGGTIVIRGPQQAETRTKKESSEEIRSGI